MVCLARVDMAGWMVGKDPVRLARLVGLVRVPMLGLVRLPMLGLVRLPMASGLYVVSPIWCSCCMLAMYVGSTIVPAEIYQTN